MRAAMRSAMGAGNTVSRVHGHAPRRGLTPTYRTWQQLVQRCTNPKNRNYADYGGRGVVVCERWMVFANFVADVGEKPNGLTLDRIDNARGYEPGNVRWVSMHEQNQNRRSTRLDAAKVREIRERHASGESSVDIAETYGVDESTVRDAALRRTWRNVQ